MKKKIYNASVWVLGIMLTFIALLSGAGSGVMMADASNLPDAGKTTGGDGGNGNGAAGIATETQGRGDGDQIGRAHV